MVNIADDSRRKLHPKQGKMDKNSGGGDLGLINASAKLQKSGEWEWEWQAARAQCMYACTDPTRF